MYQIYQIGPNESIDIIADKIGVPVEELRRINGVGENISFVTGSYIIIPKMNSNNQYTEDYSKYIVKQGDNMYTIAKNNNADLDTLISLNGLNKSDYIYPNQEIIIPNKKTYITKENDTIKDIMNKLNIDYEKIGDLIVASDQVVMY